MEASIFDSFVALSYVWGTERNPFWIQTTLSTIDELKNEGALDSSRLSQTVEDALQACEKLGERYLWVDQLCIIQDDFDNKEHHIGRMGSVYALARLVIVDCTGKSMKRRPGRHEQRALHASRHDGCRWYAIPLCRR